MYRFVARENIDHYLGILSSDVLLSAEKRATIIKLLIAEEDKLSHDLERLEFAEVRAAKCRDRVDCLRKLGDAFADGSMDRAQAERLLDNFESIHQLVEFCHKMREKVNSRAM